MTEADVWTRLARLLDDDPELIASVGLAASDPAAYFSAHERDLVDRGIEEPADVDPWLVIIDGLDEAGALAYMDWKDTGVELAEALAGLARVARTGVDLDPVADVDGDLSAAVAAADALLAPHSLRVVYLEEDSDAYPLVVVPASDAETIVAAATRLGREARTF